MSTGTGKHTTNGEASNPARKDAMRGMLMMVLALWVIFIVVIL
jgi:hypothetical protein